MSETKQAQAQETIRTYAGSDAAVSQCLVALETFIGDVDGRDIGFECEGEDGKRYFTDDGTVDASDAVTAINGLIFTIERRERQLPAGDAAGAPISATDVRWAVNYLLETIAKEFEANDTWDIWRSDAAALVRSHKHADVPLPTERDRAIVEEAAKFADGEAGGVSRSAFKAEVERLEATGLRSTVELDAAIEEAIKHLTAIMEYAPADLLTKGRAKSALAAIRALASPTPVREGE